MLEKTPSKTPSRAAAGANADAGDVENLRPRRVDLPKVPESSLEKAIRDISPQLVELAKIPHPSEKEIGAYFHEVALCWIGSAISAAFSDDHYLESLLSDVKHKATALHRALGQLHTRFNGTDRRLKNGCYDEDIDDLDLIAFQRLHAFTSSNLPSELSALARAIGRVMPRERDATGHLVPRKRGRRRGLKRYPGLSELVFLFEGNAQCHGGKFTVHRKLGAKGTLVQALDLFRDRLLASRDLKHLVDLIPPRDKHPIAVYERALKTARKNILATA